MGLPISRMPSCGGFGASLTDPVSISFSFALVSATYKTRSSSPWFSIPISFSRIFLINPGLRILFSVSIWSRPIPCSGWRIRRLRVSCLLNCLPVPLTKTTGNSSPLLLWMLMIRTTSSFSLVISASPKSTSYFFNFSM